MTVLADDHEPGSHAGTPSGHRDRRLLRAVRVHELGQVGPPTVAVHELELPGRDPAARAGDSADNGPTEEMASRERRP